MNISITIMAHPKRKDYARALLKQLRQYPFTEASIVWDQQDDEWHTGERALRAGITGGGQYHIVLQDDAIIPINFYGHVSNALKAVPVQSLVSFYTGTARPYGKRVAAAVAKAKHCSWLRADLLYWGVGIAIPTHHIADMLDMVAERQEVYDFRIGWAYQRQRLPVFYTNPSLVDHNDAIGSLLKQSDLIPASEYEKAPRKAHIFVGDRHVTWNNQVVDI